MHNGTYSSFEWILYVAKTRRKQIKRCSDVGEHSYRDTWMYVYMAVRRLGLILFLVRMARRVIASPFHFAGDTDSAVSAASPVAAKYEEPPVSNVTAKYAPPPSASQVANNKQKAETNPALSSPQSSPFPPPAQGGKLSAFAELSNRAPPPLYQVEQPQQTARPVVSSQTTPQPANFTPMNQGNRRPCPTEIVPNQDPANVPQYLTKSNPIPPPAAPRS